MLGQGVYKLSEVSKLTKMHHSRVRSWFKHRTGGVGHGPIFQSDYTPVDGDFGVSFLDLIDVLIAGQFRDKYKLPMGVVRRAYIALQKELNTKHPFCHSCLYTDGLRIFLSTANKLGEEKLSDIVSRQQFFLHIKEKLDYIDFSEMTSLASRWRISKGVIIDPSISLGKPSIENTGVTTFVIANQYHANAKNTPLVADLYDVSEQAVINAVEFEEWYKKRRVA